MSALGRRFAALPTAAKLLLILSAVLLPIGLALVWVAQQGIGEANAALKERTTQQARTAHRAIESLIARNALALRIAANGAFASGARDPCAAARQSLATSPAVAQRFELDAPDGTPLCVVGEIGDIGSLPLVAPGAIELRIAPGRDALIVRVGVVGGMASATIPVAELREAALEAGDGIDGLSMRDSSGRMEIHNRNRSGARRTEAAVSQWTIGNEQLRVEIEGRVPTLTTLDRLLLLLPLLMWVMAALITWLLVSRVLIRPLKMLERAVTRIGPGESANTLPTRLGPATEIRELRDAFARGLMRIEESECEMARALDGQRRLVREVHHRVKNNLQVVASLLNIHGRSAATPEARAAYAAIGRRVGALSIVHRNHFAEMEESRGIALRPLLAELTAELRAGAPEQARALTIELDLETTYTTQDVAVAIAFLITEIIEFAMLNRPQEPVEISLRRSSELTARLGVSSPILVPDDDSGDPEKAQFERIVAGLAKQLRSNLERKLGRYSVDLPVFPAA
ncbi:histidine kinase dimerization/phosphoacceptor domain -containing protein [Sphingomonas sp.]|uniref:sensor histidine kinase n=1 Tax=Sphingomonas sp. TaxID=28214 RepID=UPI00286DB36C|nr:histidine kinase dimerization/phosphoacceptor domain -containing protein [Sphingomonas sp.]